MTDTPAEREGGSPWASLRRRKVVQWGVAYAAAAWTLLQVIEYLAETYGWPPAVRRIAIPALALGSLLVFVLAWYHGEKGGQKVSRSEAGILAALIAAMIGVVSWYGSRLDESAWASEATPSGLKRPVTADAASVAVLPFMDMSQGHDQEYFADGLSEEILNALARIPGLYVPARTSSFQFKGRTGDVADFASRLGVANILEGSVRRSDGRLRISVQLVSAEDGRRLWSQEYDREFKDVFAIQDEIARSVTDALELRLTPGQRRAADVAQLTTDLDAYEAYLLGRYEQQKWQLESLGNAIGYYRKATALDPGFSEAYAGLATALLEWKTHPNGPDFRRDEFVAYRANVVAPLLATAQALGPDRAEVLAAAATLAVFDDDLNRAVGLMGRAIDRSPNNGVWLNRQAGWLGRLGKFQRALELNREAVKRDPLSWNALNGLVAWSLFLGHRNEVDPIVTRETAVNEVQGRGISTLVFSFDGDRAAAVREYLRIYDLLTAQSGGVGFGLRNSVCLQFARLGLRDEVLSQIPALNAHEMLGEYAEALPALREEYRESGNWRFLLANALYGTGRFDEAAEQYRRLFATSDPYPDAASLLQAADAARRSGALQEAAAYRDRAAQLIDSAESAGADMRAISRERAMLFAFDGHAEEAARSLIVALDNWNAWVWSYQPTLWNPLLAPLMDRADFKAAQRSNSLVIEKQRAQVIEMLCGPSPVSKSYKPAPATCAKRNSRA